MKQGDLLGEMLDVAADRLAAYGYLLTGSQHSGEDLVQSDPWLAIEYPNDTKVVEFISADPFGAFVDPEGTPWLVDVVGLSEGPPVATGGPSAAPQP